MFDVVSAFEAKIVISGWNLHLHEIEQSLCLSVGIVFPINFLGENVVVV